MLRIRLSRTGAKKQPSYRIVVADVEAKRDGRIVERIGHYNPRREPLEFDINEDRALYWLSVGAQPSDPVKRLLVKQGTYDRLTRLRMGEAREDLVAEFLGVTVQKPAETVSSIEAPRIPEEAEAVVAEAIMIDEEEE